MSAPSETDLLGAAAFMAERGIYGVVRTDAELRAERKYGPLVDFVPVGKPITDTVLHCSGSTIRSSC